MMTDGETTARVPDSELDYDENLIYTHQGELFTGIGYEETPGGVLSEISYRDGLQDGVSRDWYPSGRLMGETPFRENVQHGVSREFAEDGTILEETVYEYGIVVSLITRNLAGEVIKTFQLPPTDARFKLLQQYREEKGWRFPCLGTEGNGSP